MLWQKLSMNHQNQNHRQCSYLIVVSFIVVLGFCFIFLFKFEGRQHTVSHMFGIRTWEHLNLVEHILSSLSLCLAGSAPYPLSLE
jgi:heme/copper-type cytochrome/quinol oxidase subunit 2